MSDEERAEIMGDLKGSVVLAMLAAGLIGRRVVVDGRAALRESGDKVFAVKSVGESDVTLIFNDGRETRINGTVEHLLIEWEPEERSPMLGFAASHFSPFGG